MLDNSLNIELKVGELCSLNSNVGGQKRATFTKGYAKFTVLQEGAYVKEGAGSDRVTP